MLATSGVNDLSAQAEHLRGNACPDLSLIAAGFFAEDATAISTLRARLTEVQSRLVFTQAELANLKGSSATDSAELQRLRPKVDLLEAALQESELARRQTEVIRKSLENEVSMMRQALAEMSGKEAAALEAANEASWATRLHKERVDTLELRSRLHKERDDAELEAERRCRRQLVEQEQQLADLRQEIHHWRSIASRRCGDLSTLRERRSPRVTQFVQRSISRENISILQAVFDRWADDVFRKDQLELWSMHVSYLHKQAETSTRNENRICQRYGVILDRLLRRGDWQYDLVLLSQCWHSWNVQVSRMWRSVAASTWNP